MFLAVSRLRAELNVGSSTITLSPGFRKALNSRLSALEGDIAWAYGRFTVRASNVSTMSRYGVPAKATALPTRTATERTSVGEGKNSI